MKFVGKNFAKVASKIPARLKIPALRGIEEETSKGLDPN